MQTSQNADEIQRIDSSPSSDIRENSNVIAFPESTLVRVDRATIDLDCFFANEVTKGWTIIHTEPRSLLIDYFDLATLETPTCTADDEDRLSLDERMLRMELDGFIPLDAYAFVAMWEKQELFPEVWKDDIRGWWAFHFIAGSRFIDPSGNDYMLSIRYRVNAWEYTFRRAWHGLADMHPSSTMLAIREGQSFSL